MTGGDVEKILAACSQLIHEHPKQIPEGGVAAAGTFSAVDKITESDPIYAGTVEVTPLKTGAIIGDDGDQGFAKPRVTLATSAIGVQYGPSGGERTYIIPTESEPIALFVYGQGQGPPNGGQNDTYATLLAGELVLFHRNAATPPVVDVSLHMTNDGITMNDGLGALIGLLGAFAKFLTTNGTGLIIDDASNSVQLQGGGTTPGNGIVRKSDLQAALNALAMIVQPGSGVTVPTATASTKTYTG